MIPRLRATLAMFALVVAPLNVANANPYAGCTAGYQACHRVGEFLFAEGLPREAREHMGICATVSNQCQNEVRLTAADLKRSALVYFPRQSAVVSVDNGVSVLVRGQQ